MSCHAPKVELGDPWVEPFEAGGLAQFNATFLDGPSNALDLRMVSHEAIVVISLVHAARIGADQRPFQSPQVALGADEPEKDRLETSGPGVIFFVRVRGRSDHRVNGVRLHQLGDLPGVATTEYRRGLQVHPQPS